MTTNQTPEQAYWARKAAGHRKAAATFRAKFALTGERKWSKHALSNDWKANRIENTVLAKEQA